jgi:hypothetical protein
MRVAVESLRQDRQIRRDERYDLGGKPAEWTLIATMTGRRVLDRSFVVVDLDAELGRIPKERLKLGRDRGAIGARESGRGKSWRRRGGEKLNDERKRDQKGGQRRAERRRAALRTPSPKRKSLAPEAHQHSLRSLFGSRTDAKTQFSVGYGNSPAIGPSLPEV